MPSVLCLKIFQVQNIAGLRGLPWASWKPKIITQCSEFTNYKKGLVWDYWRFTVVRCIGYDGSQTYVKLQMMRVFIQNTCQLEGKHFRNSVLHKQFDKLRLHLWHLWGN
jgi:hypothetical protein